MAKSKKEEVVSAEGTKTVIRPNLEEYVTARAASGAKSQHNGDPVASALEGATLEEVTGLAVEIVGDADLATKYNHLNLGQQRMNLGNRIRGVVNKMNKEKEGSGDKYITQMASSIRQEVKGREKEAQAEAKAKEQAKAAKEQAKAKAKKAA